MRVCVCDCVIVCVTVCDCVYLYVFVCVCVCDCVCDVGVCIWAGTKCECSHISSSAHHTQVCAVMHLLWDTNIHKLQLLYQQIGYGGVREAGGG